MKPKGNRKEINKTKGPGIFGLLKAYKGMLFFLLFVALLSNAINLVIPKIISHGIDAFAKGQFDFQKTVLEFLGAAIAIFIFSYFQSIIQTFVSELVAKNMRSDLSAKISQQSFAFIENANPSKLLTNLTSDIDSVKMFVSQAVVIIVSSIFMIIGVSIMLLMINWKLALAVIVIIPIIGGTFSLVLMKVRALFKRSR